MQIITNYVPRPIIDAWELTPKERKEIDYLNWDTIDRGEDSALFFRYRGDIYNLDDFSRIIPVGAKIHHPMESSNPDFQGWDGYLSDSFFSGILIRFPEDNCETIVVGLYLS